MFFVIAGLLVAAIATVTQVRRAIGVKLA
jgi:hypothetical protein